MMAAPNRRLIVGIGSRNYGYRRVSYGLPVPEAAFRKLAYVPWRFLGRRSGVLRNTYLFADVRRTDLIHLWNGICVNNLPWITSFEAHLPRYWVVRDHWMYRWALERLRRPSCRRILALSDAARNFFLWKCEGAVADEVAEKLRVFYGGVEIDDDLAERHERFLEEGREEFVVTFVGHLFFLKGGLALLEAFERLREGAPYLRLRVISSLDLDAYGSGEDAKVRERTARRLRENPSIVWSPALAHEDVLEALCRSHVAVLPTLDDTLGWSIIEAMSLGVPVIASNVFAIPEIVDDGRNGFLIPLRLSSNRRWAGVGMRKGGDAFLSAREEAYGQLCSGLTGYVSRFLEERDLCLSMGRAAMDKVRERFDARRRGEELGRIYQACVAGC